ncbi:Ribokinase [compost metagenome]
MNCLVVNEPEAAFYCGKEIDDLQSAIKYGRELYDQTGEWLIITLGSKGSVLFNADSHIHIEARPVEAIETTGAGDSFIGALACQLLANEDMTSAAEYATKAAAITVTRIGGQPAMPTLEELEMPRIS